MSYVKLSVALVAYALACHTEYWEECKALLTKGIIIPVSHRESSLPPLRTGPVVQTAKQDVCPVSCSVRHRPTLPCLFSAAKKKGAEHLYTRCWCWSWCWAAALRRAGTARGCVTRSGPAGLAATAPRGAGAVPVPARAGSGPGRAEQPRHRPPPAPLAGPGRRGRAAGTAAGSPGRASRVRRCAPPYHGGGSLQPPRWTARARPESQGRIKLQDGPAGGGQSAAVRTGPAVAVAPGGRAGRLPTGHPGRGGSWSSSENSGRGHGRSWAPLLSGGRREAAFASFWILRSDRGGWKLEQQ